MYFSPRSRATFLTALFSIALPTLLTRPATAFAQTHAATTSASPKAPRAKISAKQAEAAAVKKIPGKVNSSKYEFEDGHWQYAVVLTDKKGQMYELAVSSTTGKVTDTEKTSASEEVKEEAADKKKAMSLGGAPKTMGGDKEKDDEKNEKDEKGSKG